MLVFDVRPGEEPAAGLHALIVGISVYPNLPGATTAPSTGSGSENLGLEQLEAPALTAHQIYRWLLAHRAELPVPLHSVRLLLAPSPSELEADPGITEAQEAGAADASYRSLQAALNAWREDLSRFAGSMAFFFYSGHGLGGTGEDALMLAADFGDAAVPMLERAISITDVEQGMAPPRRGGRRTIGRRQVYLVDACRNRPAGLEPDSAAVPTVWTQPVETDVDDRELSILLATINSRRAYVGKDGEATVFGQAVLECLQGAAAQPVEEGGQVRWAVSTTDISTQLPERMAERTKALRVSQAFRTGRQHFPVRLLTFQQTPEVTVTFPTVGATLPSNVQLQLDNRRQVTKIGPLEPPTREHRLPMGFYDVTASAIMPPPSGNVIMECILRPPRREVWVDF